MPIHTAPQTPPEHRVAAIKSFLRFFSAATQVEFSFTESPQTDGRTVWLGNLDPSHKDFEIYAAGHGIHEMMHVYATSMEAIASEQLPAFTKALVNVLEDVRIDGLGMELYPGYAAYRYELSDKLEEQGRLHVCADPNTLEACELFCVWLHAALMRPLGAPWALRRFETFDAAIRSKLDVGKLDKALEKAKSVYSIKDTAGVVTLAKNLTQMLLADQQAAQGERPGKDAKAQTGAFERRLRATDEEQLEHCRRLLDQTPPEQARLGYEDGAQRAGAAGAGYSSATATKGNVGLWKPDPNLPETHWDGESYISEFAKGQPQIEHLSRVFSELLATPSESNDSTIKSAGLGLSSDFLSRIATKDERLFMRPALSRSPDGAVEILLDRSGSMGLAMLTSAKLAVSALMSALCERKGVSVEAAVFPGPSKTAASVVLQRGEALSAGLERMRSVTSYGGTPLWNAIEWAVGQLRPQKAGVKLLILITDGIFPARLLRDAESIISRAGIEFAVISIEADNHGLARNQCNIREPGEIAPALIRLVKKTAARRRLTQLG